MSKLGFYLLYKPWEFIENSGLYSLQNLLFQDIWNSMTFQKGPKKLTWRVPTICHLYRLYDNLCFICGTSSIINHWGIFYKKYFRSGNICITDIACWSLLQKSWRGLKICDCLIKWKIFSESVTPVFDGPENWWKDGITDNFSWGTQKMTTASFNSRMFRPLYEFLKTLLFSSFIH